MGKKRKRSGEKGSDGSFADAVLGMLAQALGQDGVARCTLSVDKATGLARLTTSGADGRVGTQEIFGPGLALDPLQQGDDPMTAGAPGPAPTRSNARAMRDAAIVTLAARGLTQTETARVLSVSQALVSKVLRAAAQ
jgi:hypothetical protein